MKYAHLLFYALVLVAVYGFLRPSSRAGHAVTSVTDALSGTLRQHQGGGS